jgi:formylglycine-generating enzyme required for sulfatase activity
VLQISKAGYEKTTRKVRISPDESKQLKVSLKSVEGTVHLMVEPPDAELLVDGRSMGAAPKELRLVAVEQTLEFRKKGYRSFRTRITPQPGFPKQLKIALTGEETPEKAPPDSITTKTGHRLNLIHPGPFIMGSSRREQGRRANETLRSIDLKRLFYLGAREVTNKEFKEFMPLHNSGVFKSHRLNDADQPVVRVTWEEAVRFCNWLSEKESLPPAYIKKGDMLVAVDPLNAGYRLPTEAEWEYCARYVDKQTLLKYPWGQNFPPERSSGNFSDQSAKDLLSNIIEGYNDGYAVAAPPGRFKPNRLDLYDMGGNAAEWCTDYYTLYSHDPERTYVDPGGPREGKHHVIRGSSWQNGSISTLRLTYRGYGNDRREDVGFRVCRYLE